MRFLKTLAVTMSLAGAALSAPSPVHAQTLRIGMTTSDVPTTGGIPDNGSEGGRFAGYTIYDALVNWDFTHPDRLAGMTPGLATEWHVDPQDNKNWIFTLRQGVKFHDGEAFTADDVIFTLDRLLNRTSPVFDKAQAGSYSNYTAPIGSYAKIDDFHVRITTKVPYSPLPYLISRVFIVSPEHYQKVGSWSAYTLHPDGTGPFKVTRVTPHVSIELDRNENYWDKTRIPKIAHLVLMPIPDANTRVAALRSGQVDWVEFPAPDSLPSLRQAGFNIVLKPYPHIWAFQLNDTDNSALKDVRIRQALNYGIDRDGMVDLVGKTATPATGFYEESSPLYGNPTEHYKYDPEKAKALLKAAGYGPDHPLKLKIQLPTAGSGNMVPLPMGEFLQENLHDIGVNIDYEVVDWGTMLTAMRQAPDNPSMPYRDGIAHGLPLPDASNFYSEFTSMAFSPNGSNWSHYKNPKVDEIMAKAFATFDEAGRDKLIAQAHAIVVDDAAWLFVVHDLNPRALSPKVKGFVQVQSWYQDFTQLTVTQ